MINEKKLQNVKNIMVTLCKPIFASFGNFSTFPPLWKKLWRMWKRVSYQQKIRGDAQGRNAVEKWGASGCITGATFAETEVTSREVSEKFG
jgi:hypothetical protein